MVPAMDGRARLQGLPPFLAETVSEAIGQSHRKDPVTPRTGGPAGNANLTAWTGLLLLALSVAETFTLLDVRGLISWHVVIGVLLVPPAILKTATTGWRILSYYRRSPAYAKAGPPPMLLRILGPAVVLSTLGLLGSGLLLIALGTDASRRVFLRLPLVAVDALSVHQGLFVIWILVTSLHVLGRFIPALRLTVARPPTAGPLPGSSRRAVALVCVAVVAVVAAPLVLYASGSWQSDQRDGEPGGGRPISYQGMWSVSHHGPQLAGRAALIAGTSHREPYNS
jgi:hypothetical protein